MNSSLHQNDNTCNHHHNSNLPQTSETSPINCVVSEDDHLYSRLPQSNTFNNLNSNNNTCLNHNHNSKNLSVSQTNTCNNNIINHKNRRKTSSQSKSQSQYHKRRQTMSDTSDPGHSSPTSTASLSYNFSKCFFLTRDDEKISRITKALFISAFCFIIASFVILYFNMPDYALSLILTALLTLEKSSNFRQQWEVPVPSNTTHLHISFYVFNLTNYEEFIDGQAKANLQEIGPITYSFNITRKIIDETENELTYANIRNHSFNAALSADNINPKTTTILHPNLPKFFVTNMGYIASLGISALETVSFFKDSKSYFVENTIHDFLWGYDYDLLSFADKLSMDLPTGTKFGLLTDQNNTYNIQYKVNKGILKTEDLLKIIDIQYSNNQSIQCWQDAQDNDFTDATDIEQISPKKFKRPDRSQKGLFLDLNNKNDDKNHSDIKVFIEESFRSFNLKYKGNFEHPYTSSSNGQSSRPIPVDRYVLNQDSLNRGNYCHEKDISCKYRKTGVMDISNCRKLNFPLLWSSPYFHHAEDYYFENITDEIAII